MQKRFTLPDYCTVGEFVMRELTAKDELTASIFAEKFMSDALRNSAVATIAAEQREAMRIALVEVDGKPVNVDGIPYMAMDEWSMRTIRFAQMAFNELNGIESDDLKNFRAGGQIVDPGESPAATQSQKPASGSGKSGRG